MLKIKRISGPLGAEVNGIDLNGRTGMSMFSIDSMKPKIQQNVGGFDVDMIVGNENIINQEVCSQRMVE